METITTFGTLYLCATPIGNLEDMTFRAVRILGEADLIAAEDTRHTRKLLTHFDIHTSLTSYHEHNKFEKGPELIELLLAGKNLVVVSDAGLPGIADPGSHLVELAIEAGITVTPLPGANAALSGLICSGLDTTKFTFVGFLPKTTKKRREVLAGLVKNETTLLFYESPHRLKATLSELLETFGERRAVAARELTKKFEEFIRGSLVSLKEHFNVNQPRGEFALIIEGYDYSAENDETGDTDEPVSAYETVMKMVEQGIDKKIAIKEASVKLGLSKREVYQAVLEAEKKVL
ncbi:MAG: Ribosomal small subunit methyltransferase [Firmicutes bacterium]|nr:Ribosomal small subunit methyltransferase [Bacillota bacterium]